MSTTITPAETQNSQDMIGDGIDVLPVSVMDENQPTTERRPFIDTEAAGPSRGPYGEPSKYAELPKHSPLKIGRDLSEVQPSANPSHENVRHLGAVATNQIDSPRAA